MARSGSDVNRSRESITLSDIRDPLSGDLDRIESRITEQLDPNNPVLESAIEANTTTRGKRMRPILLLRAAEATGGIQQEHYQIAAVIELIHAATLVHDDVLDQGEFRRKHVTVNEKFGNELAVLFGDFIFSNAYLLTVDLDRSDIRIELARTAQDVCRGEIWQTGNKFNFEIEESTYLEMIRLKTASLFEASAKLGAMVNNAEKRIVEAFGEFGTNFGMAFQIVDDYLDLVGDETFVGKSLGTDLQKGKVTMPVLQLFSRMNDDQRQEAIRLIDEHGRQNGEEQNGDETDEEARKREFLRDKFTDWLSEFGLDEGHKEFAGKYLKNARNAIHELTDPESYREIQKLVDFAEQRYR